MLFVIVMEALNSLIREADRRLALTPLPGHAIAHCASLYADNLVLLVAPQAEDLQCIIQILELFAGASGLVTNVKKCVAMPISCSAELIEEVQHAFPCVVAPFPCTYLGALLSLTRLRRADEQALVDKVAARIPTWKAGLLTHSGRVLLTKVTLTAIPIHVSISCCLSKWALEPALPRSLAGNAKWRGQLYADQLILAGLVSSICASSVCAPAALRVAQQGCTRLLLVHPAIEDQEVGCGNGRDQHHSEHRRWGFGVAMD